MTKLYRFIETTFMQARFTTINFIDKYGKITVARYKLIEAIEHPKTKKFAYLWKLDGRSVRYMKRKRIIENNDLLFHHLLIKFYLKPIMEWMNQPPIFGDKKHYERK